jgi:hypothetical protein
MESKEEKGVVPYRDSTDEDAGNAAASDLINKHLKAKGKASIDKVAAAKAIRAMGGVDAKVRGVK